MRTQWHLCGDLFCVMPRMTQRRPGFCILRLNTQHQTTNTHNKLPAVRTVRCTNGPSEALSLFNARNNWWGLVMCQVVGSCNVPVRDIL